MQAAETTTESINSIYGIGTFFLFIAIAVDGKDKH
jgi:hypothetical protein